MKMNNANNATYRDYVKLGKKRWEGYKRNYYMISPRVIRKPIIITLLIESRQFWLEDWLSA